MKVNHTDRERADFLNIFADSVRLSIEQGKKDRLTPTYIYKAASQASLRNKRSNLSEEAGVADAGALERAFADIVTFCLVEKKRTAFLISHDDAGNMSVENEILQQLMDFKLIHLISTDTSAASGRSGRYSAYTLDASVFMEPRRRGIDVVEFWKRDESHRPVGVRESPTYPLARIAAIKQAGNDDSAGLDSILESLPMEDHAADQPEA